MPVDRRFRGRPWSTAGHDGPAEPEALKAVLSAHLHVLYEAVSTVGLSANAVCPDEPVPGLVTGAQVIWPSYFCDRDGFVGTLAYLVRNNLPFDLEVEVVSDGTVSRYKLHPGLDPATRQLLAEIDPATAQRVADLTDRTERVIARLQQVATG